MGVQAMAARLSASRQTCEESGKCLLPLEQTTKSTISRSILHVRSRCPKNGEVHAEKHNSLTQAFNSRNLTRTSARHGKPKLQLKNS